MYTQCHLPDDIGVQQQTSLERRSKQPKSLVLLQVDVEEDWSS
jgi:hypothetical protein